MEAGSGGGPQVALRSTSSTAAPSANAAAGTASPSLAEPTTALDAWLQQVEQQPSQLLACTNTAEQRRQQHLALALTLQQLDALAAAAFCSKNTRKKRRIISNDDASDTLRAPSFSDSKRTMTPRYFSSLLIDSSPLSEALPRLFSDPLASRPPDTAAAGKGAAPGLGSPLKAGAGDACDDTQLRTVARAAAKREEEGEQQQKQDENQALSLQQVWVFVDTTAWKLLRRLKEKVSQVHATEVLCRRKAQQRRKKLRWWERKRSALAAASQAEQTCTEALTGATVEDLEEGSIPDLPPPSSSHAAQQAIWSRVGKGSAPAAAAPTAAMETPANSSPAATATIEEAGTTRPPSRNGMAGCSPSDWTSGGGGRGGGGGGGGFFWLLREQPSASQQEKYVSSQTETAGGLEAVKTALSVTVAAAADDVDSACENGSGRDHEEEQEKDEEEEEENEAEAEDNESEEEEKEEEENEEKEEGKATAEISERGEDKRDECVPTKVNNEEDKSDDMFFSMEDMQRFVLQEEERELARQHANMRKSNMLRGNSAVTNGVKKKKKGKNDDSEDDEFFSADEDEEMWELLYSDNTGLAATQGSTGGELKDSSRDRSSTAMYSDFFAAPSKTYTRRERKRSGETTDNEELISSKKRDREDFDTVRSSTTSHTTTITSSSGSSSSKVKKRLEAAQVESESAEEREVEEEENEEKEEEEEVNDEEGGEISAVWKSRRKKTERSRKKDRKDEKERRDSNSSNSTTSSGSEDGADDDIPNKRQISRGFPVVGNLDAEERRLQRVLEEFEQQQRQQRRQQEKHRMKENEKEEDDHIYDDESEEDESIDEVSLAIKKGKKASEDDDAATKKTEIESTEDEEKEEEEMNPLRRKKSSSNDSSDIIDNKKQQEMKDDVHSLRGLISHSNEVEAAMLELEQQLVSKKEWKLQGEVWGKQRPRNALLDIGQLDLPLLASGLFAGEHLGGMQTLSSSSLALGQEVAGEEGIYENEQEEERRIDTLGTGGEIMSNYSSKTRNNSDKKNISQLSSFIETLVKQRIMENLFDDVVRRRTMLSCETEQQQQRQKQKEQQLRMNMDDPTRGDEDNSMGLNMQQSNMGLADIYAAEYQRQLANTGLLGHQEKTHKLSEEEKKKAEILELFGKLLYKLDCLSNTSFRPAPAAATHFQNPTDLEGIAAVRVEEAVPLLLSTAARQAPQELYKMNKTAEKEAFTKEERRALRQSKKEKRRKRIYHMVQSGALTLKGAQERKMKLAVKNKLQKADKLARRQTGLTQHDAIKEMRKHSKKVKFQDLLSDALKASQNKNKRTISSN